MTLWNFKRNWSNILNFGKDLNTDIKYILKEDSDGEEACNVGEVYMDAEMSDCNDIGVVDHVESKEATKKNDCDPENAGSPSALPGKYTEEVGETPLSMTSSQPRDKVSPVFVMPLPLPAHMMQAPDVVIKHSPSSASHLEETALGDDFNVEENSFHLADEHQVYQQPSGRPERPHKQQRGKLRGRPRAGAQREGRRHETDAHKWVRADRLIDVNDDDVPVELRDMAMGVVAAREAAKVRTDGEDVLPERAVWLKWPSIRDYSRKKEIYLPKRTEKGIAAEKAYAAYRQYWEHSLLQHMVMEKKGHYPGVGSWSACYAREWPDITIENILGPLDAARHYRNQYHELQLLPDVNLMAYDYA